MADIGARITGQLTIRYVAVLGVLGALAIASFLGVARFLLDTEGGAALVNVAGRQRTLVERTAYLASRLAAEPQVDAASRRQELSEALDRLESGHAGILSGLPELKTPLPPSPAVKALLFGPRGDIDRELRSFIAHGRTFSGRAGSDLAAIQAAADGPLLAELDALASLYQTESDAAMVRLFTLHGALLIASLLLLVVSAAVVFHPMVRRIRADFDLQAASERVIRDSEARLWRILEESPVGVSVSDRSDGQVVFANARFCEIVGQPKAEVVGHPAAHHYVNDAQRMHFVAELKARGCVEDAEAQFVRKDGTPFWSLLTLRSTKFEDRQVNLAWVYDISAVKAAEARLELLARVVETASEAVVITDASNIIQYVNPAFTGITEFTATEAIGKSPAALKSGRHDNEFYRNMWRSLSDFGRWQGEIWNRRKSGEFYAEWLSIVAIKDEHGVVTNFIAVFSDITHRKEDEERVWRQANYDALTGLPNRSLFNDRLAQAVRQGTRDGKKFALMFIDLDGFKAVNDTLGHAAGDVLLQQAGDRLCQCVRASDTVARLAGDEFTVIMQGINGQDDVTAVATKILETLAQPFDLAGKTANVYGSIGIAIFPDDAGDGPSLLHRADHAMYAVKRQGKNGFRLASQAV